jgi:ABC-2 type transport system permease protein
MPETLAAARAELTKLRAVRSLGAALLLFVAVSFLVAVLDGWSAKGAIESNNPGLRPDFTATQAGLDGVLYGQLAVIVFGVLVGSCGYTSGLMPSSLLAVPRRGRLFLAKTLVAGAVMAALAVPVCVGGYLVTQTALGSHGASITAPGVPRALTGAVAYLTLMCLFALGSAMAARQAVGPLAVLLPMVLVGSHLLSLVRATRDLAEYLPDRAGTELLTIGSDQSARGMWVLVCWALVALAAGFVRCRRWDG